MKKKFIFVLLGLTIFLSIPTLIFCDNASNFTDTKKNRQIKTLEKYNDSITLAANDAKVSADTAGINKKDSEIKINNNSADKEFEDVINKIKEINSKKEKSSVKNQLYLGSKGDKDAEDNYLKLLVIWQ